MAVYPAAAIMGWASVTKSTKNPIVNKHHKNATNGLYSCSNPFIISLRLLLFGVGGCFQGAVPNKDPTFLPDLLSISS